jgi:glutamine synthetase
MDAAPAFGTARFGGLHGYFRALLGAADAACVGVEQMHPEHGQGQVEASLRAREPVFACDDTVIFRILASVLAEREGHRASFSPKPFLSEIGNGHHLHVSVWNDDDNLFASGSGSNGMHPIGEAFLAGVLEHLPALTALGASSPVSYVRLRPSQWAGAFACWGVENREAGLRLEGIATGNPTAANVEWKAVDPTANPYLAVGGMIAAGIDGVRRGIELPKPIASDPATLSDAQRSELGIRPLPGSLHEAGEAFGRSAVLREAMGPFLHACIEAVRLGEAEAASSLSDDELCELYRFRY